MTNLNRRKFIKNSGLGLGGYLMLPALGCMLSCNHDPEPVVETAYGKIRGYYEGGIYKFKGVPYAGSVSGKRRFLAPVHPEPWKGILDASKLGHPSIQIPGQTYGIDEPGPAEDCLTLNIWTPSPDGKKRAVMVYNHGGGYLNGSAGSVYQDGSNLARMFDVVVVATNHRLGLLGYLYLDEIAGGEYRGSGNRGVQDIAFALRWVHENIERFGGDPGNVMIFGESGGGLKTSALYAMPEAEPYFNKASIESGPGVLMKEADLAARTTELLLTELGLSNNTWEKILEIPAAQLLNAQVALQSKGNKSLLGGFKGIGAAGLGGFGPVVDGVVLPDHPFSPEAPDISIDKPLVVGWNEDEQIFFSMFGGDQDAFHLSMEGLKERLQKNFSDDTDTILKTYRELKPDATPSQLYFSIYSFLSMGLGSIEIANKKARQQGAPVYVYNFGYKSELKIPGTDYEFGAMHAMDIPFKFYNVDGITDRSGHTGSGMAGNREERFDAAQHMCAFWTSFAETGRPVASGQPEWQAYDPENRALMRIDDRCEIMTHRYDKEIELWKEVFNK